jgi:hypothetical protein
MATLDKDTIEQAARGALGVLRREQPENAVEQAAADMREQVEQVVDKLQRRYGLTRQTAREDIDGFLNDLKTLDPALPGIVADAANEMTGRKGRRGLAVLALIVAVVLGVATLLWWRNTETYRSLIESIGRDSQE